MSHVRTQIRQAATAALAGIATVHASRVHPLAESDLPALLVYTSTESIEAELAAFGTLERRLELVIEAVAQATSNLDTTLDDLLASVETALGAVPTLGGAAIVVVPTSIEVTISQEGAQPIGRARLTYAVLYRTSSTDPTASI